MNDDQVQVILSAIDKNFSSSMKAAVAALNDVSNANDHMASKASSSGSTISSTTGRMVSGFTSIASAMGLVAVASKAFGVLKDAVGSAITRIDTLNNSARTFSNMGFSSSQIKSAMDGLNTGIKGLPTSLDQAVKGTQMLAASTNDLGVGQKVFTAMNDAIIGFGGSTADVQNGVLQLSQALANGKIDAQTWNSMLNSNMGPALNAIARQMGITTGQLKDGLSSGKISVKQFEDALIGLDQNGGGGLKSLHKIALEATSGIGTSMQNAKTAVVRGVGDMIAGINNALAGAGLPSIAQMITNVGVAAEKALGAVGKAAPSVMAALTPLFRMIGSLANNGIFQSVVVGALSMAASFGGISKAIAIFQGLQKEIIALKVIASVAKDVDLLKFALSNMANESKIAAVAMKVLNVVTGMNPWVLLASAIVAVVAALAYFFTQTKTGRALWAGFISWLSGVWQSLVGVATTVWSAIGKAIAAVVNFIKPLWQGLVSFLSGIWQSIMAVAMPIWMGIVNVVRSVVNLIVTLWQGLAAIVGPIIAAVVMVIGAILMTLVGIWTTVWNALLPVLQIVWQSITAVITLAISVITTMITTGITIIVTVWTTIWNVLVTVVSTVWSIIGTVITAGLQVIVDIVTAITDALQGNWSGAWNALKNIAVVVLSAIRSVVTTVMSGVAGVFSSVMNGLKGVTSAVWNAIKGVFNAGVSFIKSVVHVDLSAQGRAIMNSLLSGLKSAWEGVKSFVSGIGSWIASHKGPISYDRKLLIPAGQAIMAGFNRGLMGGFSAVQANVLAMAGAVQDAATLPGLNDSAFARSLGAVQGRMGNLSADVNGSFGSNVTNSADLQSRLWQSRMEQMMGVAIDKLDNVDQHPVVTVDTLNRINSYNNKINADMYSGWRGR